MNVRLRRPLDVISGRPQDVRLGRPPDVISGRPRNGQIGSLGDVLGTLEGNGLGMSCGLIFSGRAALKGIPKKKLLEETAKVDKFLCRFKLTALERQIIFYAGAVLLL